MIPVGTMNVIYTYYVLVFICIVIYISTLIVYVSKDKHFISMVLLALGTVSTLVGYTHTLIVILISMVPTPLIR